MQPRAKTSLLWGAIGTLVFLVLVQGYTLVTSGPAIGILATLGAAVVVGVCGTVSSYALEGWLTRNERS